MKQSLPSMLIDDAQNLKREMRALVQKRRAIAPSYREAAVRSRDRLVILLRGEAEQPNGMPQHVNATKGTSTRS